MIASALKRFPLILALLAPAAQGSGIRTDIPASQEPLSTAELTRIDAFFSSLDEAIVARDEARLLTLHGLDAREQARETLAPFRRLILNRHSTRAVQGWRIGATYCVFAEITVEVRRTRRSVPRESVDHRVFLLRDDREKLRIVRLVEAHDLVAPRSEDDGAVQCAECNFSIDPAPKWFVVPHTSEASDFTEMISLYHVTGRVTLVMRVVENHDLPDPREDLDLDNQIAAVAWNLPTDMIEVVDERSFSVPDEGVIGYEKQIILPRVDMTIWRCYRARGHTMYAMIANGDSAAFDDEEIVADLDGMFHSFHILDPEVDAADQQRKMLHKHQPAIEVEGNWFIHRSKRCRIAGPKDWDTVPLSCGRVRWAPKAGSTYHRQSKETRPWIEVTYLHSRRKTWNAQRIEARRQSWERLFDRFKGVRRHSISCLSWKQRQNRSAVAEYWDGDYRYLNTRGQARRTRIFYLPIGRTLYVIRCDAALKDYPDLAEAFAAVPLTLSLR